MNKYTHILVAVDFSPAAEQVISKAGTMAKHDDAKISLLHVVEYLPPIDSLGEPFATANWEVDEDMLIDRAQQSLQELSKKHHIAEGNHHVQVGVPKHEIARFVEENNCDLVVMGSHGRHGISLLLGSTANAVLHEMPCDILTVKL